MFCCICSSICFAVPYVSVFPYKLKMYKRGYFYMLKYFNLKATVTMHQKVYRLSVIHRHIDI